MKRTSIIFFLTLFFLMIFTIFSSDEARALSISLDNPLTHSDFEGVANSIIDALANFVGIIAVAVLIIAGIVYIFSQGNENRTTTAKRIMLGAVIALMVVLGAKTFLKEIYIIFDKSNQPGDIVLAKKVSEIVKNILSLILSVLGMLGIISLVWGGMLYLTSAGNQEQGEKAKKQIIYSIIGLVIAIGSLVIIKQIHALMT